MTTGIKAFEDIWRSFSNYLQFVFFACTVQYSIQTSRHVKRLWRLFLSVIRNEAQITRLTEAVPELQPALTRSPRHQMSLLGTNERELIMEL